MSICAARGVSRDSDRLRTPGAASEVSKGSKMDTVTVITEGSEVTIPPPFGTDDTYGIPILEVSSSDSEVCRLGVGYLYWLNVA